MMRLFECIYFEENGVETQKDIRKRNENDKSRRSCHRICCAAFMAVLFFLCCSLTGCQLAVGETGGEKDPLNNLEDRDRLVGMFATTEWVDLFDNEAWLQDNIDLLNGGNLFINDSDTQEYQSKRYAKLVETPLYDENGVEKGSSKEYVFEGLTGEMVYAAKVYDENGEYIACGNSGGISLSKNHLFTTDAGQRTELEGTLYVVSTEGFVVYNLYPIYQEPDGDVYLADGSGISFDADGEGMSMSKEYKEEITYTDSQGKVQEAGSRIKLTVEVIYRPETVVINQMGADGQLVSRGEYPAGEVPGELKPEADTEYLVVEMYKKGKTEETVERQLYNKEETYFTTLYATEDGVCELAGTTVAWPEE